MPRSTSFPDYRCFLADPDLLSVPVSLEAPPLPELIEPSTMPTVCVPANYDHEPMVMLEHRSIRILSPYWHGGWPSARQAAFVRTGVATRLACVATSLPPGFGLAILDAWRSLELQREIYEAAYADSDLPQGFVSLPSADPTTPPPHLTGGAVDVTLTWEGHPLALGSGFDDFTDQARAMTFEDTPGRVRSLRRLLFWAMQDQGFRAIDCEWWHFELGTRRWAALTGNSPWYGAADIVLAHPPGFTNKFRVVDVRPMPSSPAGTPDDGRANRTAAEQLAWG